jgi:uncharacterized delta-60 repeat protein
VTRPHRIPFVLFTTLAAILFWVFPANAAPLPGDLDPSFSGDGWVATGFPSGGNYYGVALQGNAPAGCGNLKGPSLVGVYGPGGSLDPSFSGDGKRVVDFLDGGSYLEACRYLPDGRLVAVGATYTAPGRGRLLVAVFKPNGAFDPDFSGDGWAAVSFPDFPEVYGYDLVVLPGGKILVAAETYDDSFNPAKGNFAVARFTANGALDDTFSGDGRAIVNFEPGDDGAWKIVVDPDGRIVLTGWVRDLPNAEWDTGVAVLRPNGAPDDHFSGDGRRVYDFAPGGSDYGLGLDVRPDGRIVLGADIEGTPHDSAVAQLMPGGAMDGSFGGGDGVAPTPTPDFRLQDVLLDGGKILIGGLRYADDTPGVIRLRSGGGADDSFGTGGVSLFDSLSEGWLYDLALDAQGRIVGAGNFNGRALLIRVLS